MIVILVASLSACDNNDLPIPDCLKADVISEEPPLEIWEWKYPGQTYYYIVSPCCDQFNLLLNQNCEVVCAPDGGITGKGDGNCPDLSGDVSKRLLWKQEP